MNISEITSSKFEEHFGFPVDELTLVTKNDQTRTGGQNVYYKKTDDKYAFYEYTLKDKVWYTDDGEDAYEYYYYTYMCKDEEELKNYKKECEERKKQRQSKSQEEFNKNSYTNDEFKVEPARSFSTIC